MWWEVFIVSYTSIGYPTLECTSEICSVRRYYAKQDITIMLSPDRMCRGHRPNGKALPHPHNAKDIRGKCLEPAAVCCTTPP